MTETKKTVWTAVVLAVLAGAMASAHVGKLPPAMPLIRWMSRPDKETR